MRVMKKVDVDVLKFLQQQEGGDSRTTQFICQLLDLFHAFDKTKLIDMVNNYRLEEFYIKDKFGVVNYPTRLTTSSELKKFAGRKWEYLLGTFKYAGNISTGGFFVVILYHNWLARFDITDKYTLKWAAKTERCRDSRGELFEHMWENKFKCGSSCRVQHLLDFETGKLSFARSLLYDSIETCLFSSLANLVVEYAQDSQWKPLIEYPYRDVFRYYSDKKNGFFVFLDGTKVSLRKNGNPMWNIAEHGVITFYEKTLYFIVRNGRCIIAKDLEYVSLLYISYDINFPWVVLWAKRECLIVIWWNYLLNEQREFVIDEKTVYAKHLIPNSLDVLVVVSTQKTFYISFQSLTRHLLGEHPFMNLHSVVFMTDQVICYK
jgi:hypothetical protein